MKIKIENVHGLEGRHAFEFKKGLNIILAPNASGSSSIVRAFAILVSNSPGKGREALFGSASKGSITLSLGNDEYRCILKRVSETVNVAKEKSFDEPAIESVVVVNEDHPLVSLKPLGEEAIETYLRRIANVEGLHSQMCVKKEALTDKKEKLSKVNIEIKRLECAEKREHELAREINSLINQLSALEAKKTGGVEQLRKDYQNIVEKFEATKAEAEKKKSQLKAIESEIASKEDALEKVGREYETDDLEKREAKLKDLLNRSKQATLPKSKLITIYSNVLAFTEDAMKIEKEGATCEEEKEILKLASECPICSLFKLECNFGVFSLKERQKVLLSFIESTHEIRDRLKREHDELSKKYVALLAQKERCLQETEEIKKSLVELKKLQKILSQELSELVSKMIRLRRTEMALNKQIAGIEEQKKQKKLLEHEKIKSELAVLKAEKESLKKQLEELEKLKKEQFELEESAKKAEEEYENCERAYLEKLHAARKLFNEKAAEVLKSVGYKGFESFMIDEDFHIKIERCGRLCALSELSTSEWNTIALLLSVAAKKAYLPSFPFFIVDTTTALFDQSKFPRLLKYICEQSEYTIVTRLAPEECGMRIVHGLEQLS